MLKLISLHSCIATLQFQTSHTLSLIDWNPHTKILSHSRDMRFQVSAIFADPKYLEDLLSRRPEAQIIHGLTHDWTNGNGVHKIVMDGEVYYDEFGLPVYLYQVVDWEGELTDIDERYEGTEFKPEDSLNL